MPMRTILAILMLFALGSVTDAYSQSWLEHVGRTAVRRAKDRAVQKVEDKVYETAEKAAEKAVDKAFEKTEEAITEAAEKSMEEADIRRAEADSAKAALKAEQKALEQARKQKESEDRKQLVLKQFSGRAASNEAPFYMSKEGVSITYANKDSKGKAGSHSKTTITGIDYKDSRNFTVESSTELYDGDMELLTSAPMTSKTTVENGVVTFDPESMAGQLAEGMEISGDFFFVPDNIAVGDILMDYKVTIAIGPMTTTSENTDVHVSGRETIEISGHSIDCYIIESRVTAKAMGFKTEVMQKAWYGRGIGQVKVETYNSKGNLQSVNEIVAIDGL